MGILFSDFCLPIGEREREREREKMEREGVEVNI